MKLKQSTIKKTGKMRYKFVALIIKHLTPSLYKKINLILLIEGQMFNFKQLGVSIVPRPSIKIMKQRFNGKLVKGAEIGVNRGVNSESILKELNIEKLYLIDIWNNYEKIDYVRTNIYQNYKIVLKKFKKDKRVRVIKDFSQNAVKYVDDDSLDFVYIDANHSYKYVYQDIDLWFRKVKEGGIVAGHDVFNCSDVLDAVKDFCSKNKIIFHIKLPDWYFIKHAKRWYLIKEGRNLKYSLELVNPEKEGMMPYFKINCPFCEGNSVSDVIDSIEDVDGQWECSNGHQFVIKYIRKIE